MAAFVVRTREELAQAFDRLRSNDETLRELDLLQLGIDDEDDQLWLLTSPELTNFTAALSVNSQVETLDLFGCLSGIPSEVIRPFFETVLSIHPCLKNVNLGENELGDDHVVMIAGLLKTNTTLQGFCLQSNEIGVEGVRALADALPVNKTLEELSLFDNPFGDKGWQAIASVLPKSSLTILSLGFNGISNEGVLALADGLIKNKSLKQLDLGQNSVDDEGCHALAKALRHNSSLCELHLGSNKITSVGADALEVSLQHANYTLETLDLISRNDGITQTQQERINLFCQDNKRIKRAFAEMKAELQDLPFCLWSRALHLVNTKPDLIFATLKSKPELCRESVLVGRLRREIAELRAQAAELRTQVQNEQQMRLEAEAQLERVQQGVHNDDDADDDEKRRKRKRGR